MTIELSNLKRFELIYVGTPYTKYRGGIDAAFIDACKVTARLLSAGLRVYSPIAHTHPIAIHGGLDPLDHKIWLPFDSAMMHKADAMIAVMLEGWETSYGVRHEMEVFAENGKQIFFLEPISLQVTYGSKVTV